MRRSSGSAARSVSRSAAVNSRSNSSASQPSRRARVVCSRSRPGGGQLDERAAAVVGVRAAGDEPGGLEVAHRLRHGLRPHALGGGEVAGARGALAVEAPEDRHLADRRLAALRAQTPDDPSEGLAELMGEWAPTRPPCGEV